MIKNFQIAGAVLVGLEITKSLVPAISYLPLGSSHIAQIGVVFGFAFVVTEIVNASKSSGDH